SYRPGTLVSLCHTYDHHSLSFFFFYCSGHHRDLHSFPTRRSSDLRWDARRARSRAARRSASVSRRRSAAGWWACSISWTSRLPIDRKSTRLNSSHVAISYAVFCLKKKKKNSNEEKK